MKTTKKTSNNVSKNPIFSWFKEHLNIDIDDALAKSLSLMLALAMILTGTVGTFAMDQNVSENTALSSVDKYSVTIADNNTVKVNAANIPFAMDQNVSESMIPSPTYRNSANVADEIAGIAHAASSTSRTAKIYNWKQTDSRWNKIYPSNWKTGCAATSIAIQIARTPLVSVDEKATRFNKSTGSGFNPGTFAKAWGLGNDLSVSWSSQTKVVPGFVTVTKNVIKGIDSKAPNPSSAGWHYYNATSEKHISKAMEYFLDNGYYPIIEGPGSKWASNKSSVHYVAVVDAYVNDTGYDVRVIDPADGKEKSLFNVNVGGGRWTAARIERCGRPNGYGCCRLYKVDMSKIPENLKNTTTVSNRETATYITLKAINSTDYIKTMPCSASTNPESKSVRRITKGETFIATAIIKNSAGKYWYKVTATKDNKTGYIYGGCASFIGVASNAVKGNAQIPTTTPKKGKAQTISGTIASSLNIVSITGNLKGAGSVQTARVTVGAKSFSIKGSEVDSCLKFGKLAAGRGSLQISVAVSVPYISNNKLVVTTQTIQLPQISFTVIR